MREIFTHNLTAKLVSLVLAVLVWAVIKKSQLGAPGNSLPEWNEKAKGGTTDGK